MTGLKSAQKLLRIAREDLLTARAMLDESKFVDRVFGFHAQQATEKLLKAWISALDLRFPYTHELRLLTKILAENGIDTTEYSSLLELTQFAVEYRYDDELIVIQPFDRLAILELIEKLFVTVESIVNRGLIQS